MARMAKISIIRKQPFYDVPGSLLYALSRNQQNARIRRTLQISVNTRRDGLKPC